MSEQGTNHFHLPNLDRTECRSQTSRSSGAMTYFNDELDEGDLIRSLLQLHEHEAVARIVLAKKDAEECYDDKDTEATQDGAGSEVPCIADIKKEEQMKRRQ